MRAVSAARGWRSSATVEDWLDAMPALAAEDTLRQRLAASRRSRCRRRRRRHVGPHRSDLAVEHAGNGIAGATMPRPASRRRCCIAILLAQARLQRGGARRSRR